jgi:hypothetical protein
MNNKRRDFLKLGSVASLGFISNLVSPVNGIGQSLRESRSYGSQRFNMSGYAAPKLDKVRIGFIGLGNRGPAHVSQTSKGDNGPMRSQARKIRSGKKQD